LGFRTDNTHNIASDPEIWHSTYDCELEEEILFQLVPHVLPADNPQQSEHASHIGGNGLYNCRRDKLGGTDEEKENDEGYTSLFRVSTRDYSNWVVINFNF
jgi:hypothetical protein